MTTQQAKRFAGRTSRGLRCAPGRAPRAQDFALDIEALRDHETRIRISDKTTQKKGETAFMQDTMGQTLEWLLCLAPVAVLFVGIAIARVKVPVAAGAGLAAALLTAVMIGSAGSEQLLDGTSTGISAALSILYAVWPAMFLYDIMREAGAFSVLRSFAESATQDMLALILLFGWVFSSFLQSITGFGVPVAVCAPFLVALGVRPVPAVVMTLIGHSWGNTFGTLGMAWDALVQMGPVEDPAATVLLAGALLWVVNLTGGMIVAWMYGGRRALVHGLPLIALLSATMGGGQMAASLVDTTVACFLPATAALVVFAFLIKLGFYKKSWRCNSSVMDAAHNGGESHRRSDARPSSSEHQPKTGQLSKPHANSQKPAISPIAPCQANSHDASTSGRAIDAPAPREVLLCASPFVFLAAASVALFVMPGIREAASFAQIGSVQVIGHAGFVLLATCLFAAILMTRTGRLDARRRANVYRGALGRLWSASAGIILLVVMARIMQTTGQMQVLAEGVASATNDAYVPLAPALGTFGAFVTSSNMSSNILLAGFQHAMSGSLGVDPALLLAAQTAGGAAGAAIGPSTILMGAATVGAAGKEGEMLRPLLAVSFAQAALLGAIVWGVSLI